MRGQIISREFQNIQWIQDENGKEYACYSDGVTAEGTINEEKKDRCLDTNQVLGDSW